MAKKLSVREKQIRRIKQAIKRNEKQGYVLDYTSVIDGVSTAKLKKITPSELRARATHRIEEMDGTKFDVVTGEIVQEPTSQKRLLNRELEQERQKFLEQSENVSRETFEQPTPETTAPNDYNILDKIADLIEEIPRTLGVFNARTKNYENEWYWESDFPLMSIYISALETHGEQEAIEYYTKNEYQLAILLTVWKRASEKEDIEEGFTLASFILNMGYALSPEQASALGNYFGN